MDRDTIIYHNKVEEGMEKEGAYDLAIDGPDMDDLRADKAEREQEYMEAYFAPAEGPY